LNRGLEASAIFTFQHRLGSQIWSVAIADSKWLPHSGNAAAQVLVVREER
jgi:hypothetical protein